MATFKQYTASGGASETFSIKSFSSDEIKVRVDGDLKVAGTHYNITSYTANDGTVTWISPHAPSSGTVRIYRVTDINSPQATYSAGSSVKAGDLNNNQEQVLRALREENDQLIQTWDIEDNAITTEKIKDLEIANADIATNAEIAVSKLADGSARQVLQTASNGSDVEWTSNVDIPGTLDVTSTAAFDSNVTVTGTSTLATVDINGGAIDGTTVGSSSASSGAFTTLNASGTLGVTGNTTLSAAATVTGDATFNGGLTHTATGKTFMVGNSGGVNKFTVATNTGNVHTVGTLGIDGDFDVATNKFTVAAATGNTVIAGNLDVTGQFDVTGTSNYTGQQTVPGGALVKDIRVGLDGNNEVSTASGSLVLDSASGTVQVTDHFNVTGNADVDSNLNVDGTLTVDGVSTLTGAVTATGGVVGNLTGNVTGNTSGNAGTATALQNARTIGGVSFNGTANINLPGVNTAGNQNTSGNAATATDLAAAAKITNSEQGSHTANDTTYYTTSASDARYYNIGSLEEIQSGETWAADDAKIATTAAIDARIVDLVDDVGGFVPIANETSFPNTNPDVNNGAGTLVSIKALASNLVSNGSGVATISNGTVGNSTVTVNGLANSTTYPAGRGILVETTTTLNTYTFHRQLAEATATTTVANSIGNVNTCATNISNINAVAADATDIGVVAGKETEIGRLGTADAVADMNTLATTAIVADLETCADNNANISTTAGAISNVNTVAGAISNVNTTAGAIANVNTTAGAIGNVNNVGNNIANVNTVGSNIGTVNDFAARYRAPQNNANEYDTSLDVGDLYFNTTINALKVYTGSAWVAGVTQTGDYALKTGSTYTGNNIHNDTIKSIYGTASDGLEIYHSGTASYIIDNGTGDLILRASDQLKIQDTDNGENMAIFNKDGAVELYHNNVKKFQTDSNGASLFGNLYQADNDKLILGTNSDIQIYHDHTGGGYSYIFNYGPQLLKIGSDQNIVLGKTSNENYIIAKPDNAVELYYDNALKLATGSGGVDVTGGLNVSGNLHCTADGGKLISGQHDDLQIYHDGSNCVIDSNTGDFLLRNLSGSGAIYLDARPGERGIKVITDGAVELYHNNSKKLETRSDGLQVDGTVRLPADNSKLLVGAGLDLEIYHSGSNSFIKHLGDGDLYIQADNGDTLYLRPKNNEDGVKIINDGGVELFYDNSVKLNTNSGGVKVLGHLYQDDNSQLRLGDNSECQIYHSSDNNTYIHESGSGHLVLKADDLYIQNAAGSQTNIKSASGGAVELSHAGSKRFETTTGGAKITGNGMVTNDFLIDTDSGRLKCGLDEDLSLFHNGNSFLTHNGAGHFYIKTEGTDEDLVLNAERDVYIQCSAGEHAIICKDDAEVELYYNNTVKFETRGYGARVFGHLGVNVDPGNTPNSRAAFIAVGDSDTGVAQNGDGQLELWANNQEIMNIDTGEITCYKHTNPSATHQFDLGSTSYQWRNIHAKDYYAEDWFRNNNSGEGIYNQSTGQHFYSDDDDYWNIAGGSSANGLRFRDENNGTIRGYVYANNSNECGILTGVGEWGTKSVLNSATYLMYDGAETISTQSHGTRIAANKDLRFQNGNWTGNAAAKIQHHENKLYISSGSSGIVFRNHGGSDRWRMEEDGTWRPNADNSYDLGTSSYRIRNVYTYDLHLNNEGSQNDVDGTWGSWTIQEGQDDLFLLNRRNGKKYKFNLTEVS